MTAPGLVSETAPPLLIGGAPAAAFPEGGDAGSSGSISRIILRVFLENKLAVAGAIIILAFIAFSWLGPIFYHSQQTFTSLIPRPNIAPNQCGNIFPPQCPLGTDNSGYDELGRLMLSGQTDLEVGVAAAAIGVTIGVIWGALAGYVGGVLDAVMMRIVDTILSIPSLLLLIVVSTIFKPNKWDLMFIIAALSWLVPARLVRGETLTLRTREYVQAVRVMGGSGSRIVLRHIVPNAVGTIVVNATFQVADAILYLSALSYLGLGIQPPQTDWGQMLQNGTAFVVKGYWWEIIPPGLCIVLLVVAFNFVGDALRDALEVRLQRR
jgi:peptide/nickel transport system permease protein